MCVQEVSTGQGQELCIRDMIPSKKHIIGRNIHH